METTAPHLHGITSVVFGGRQGRDSAISDVVMVTRVVRHIAGLDPASLLRPLAVHEEVRFRIDLYRGVELAASYGLSDEALDTIAGMQDLLDLLSAVGTVVSGIIREERPAG